MNPNAKSIGIFGFGALISALTLLSYQYFQRRRKFRQFRGELANIDDSIPLSPSGKPAVDTVELQREQLTRNYSFFGEEAMENIQNAFVIVVGLGGVGSHAAVHLLRSGVRNLRLIDFDQVTLSSLNRHAVATRSDVGTPKVVAIKKYCHQIFPTANIEARVELFSMDKADELISSGSPVYVLDCIDNIVTKVDLLRYCVENHISVVSSMGSACKADPSRVQMTTLDQTSEDALARSVRYRLRQAKIDPSKIPVIYSTERPSHVTIQPLPVEAETAVLISANEVIILGGHDNSAGTKDAMTFNLETLHFNKLPPMPFARFLHCA